MRRWVSIAVAILAAFLLAACRLPGVRSDTGQQNMTGVAPASPTPVALSEIGGSVVQATPTAGAREPGMVLALGKHGRLSVLAQSGWLSTSTPLSFGLQSNCPVSSTVGFSQGSAWVQCEVTLTSSDGEAWAPISSSPDSRLYFGPGNRMAAVQADQITLTHDAESTTYQPDRALGVSAFPTEAAAFSPDGTLWLAGNPALYSPQLVSFDGQSWQEYGNVADGLGLTDTDRIQALLVTSKGTLYAATRNRVYQFQDGRFTLVADEQQLGIAIRIPGFSGDIYNMLEMPNGQIWLATSEGIFALDHGNISVQDRGDGLPAKDVRALALDAKGRVWAATGYGLAVLDNGKWHVIAAGSSGLADPNLVALAVRGAPDIPPADAKLRTTSVTGRILVGSEGSKPLANATVILCDEWPGANARHTSPLPCAEQYFTRTGKTDSNGWYQFEDVPLGSYTLAMQSGDNWYFAMRLQDEERLPLIALDPGGETRLDITLP